jgi:N-acetylmuramoyl-L-alanine amidase
MKKRTKTEYIIVHCSANVNSTPETVARTHKARGFSDVGYHYMVDKAGNVHQGRAEDLQGAHCIGRNGDSIGICLLGHFDIENPTQEMKDALTKLVDSLCVKYNIKKIDKHNTYKPTKTCPGVKAYALVDYLDIKNTIKDIRERLEWGREP